MMDLKTQTMRAVINKEMKRLGYNILKHFDSATMDAMTINCKLLEQLIRDNEDTEYGREYRFSEIKSIDDYRKNVPLTTYEDYEPYIDRMTEQGEQNLLTSYPVVYYASTSGTSGSPKKIPITDRGLKAFQEYTSTVCFAIADEYYKNVHRKPAKGAAMLIIQGLAQEPLPDGRNFGCISAACMDETKMKFLPYTSTTPVSGMQCDGGADLKYLHARYALAEKDITHVFCPYIPGVVDVFTYIVAYHEQLAEDIRTGTIGSGIQLPEELRSSLLEDLKPDPKRADEIEAVFSIGSTTPLMLQLWPNLQAITSIWAGNYNAYAQKLQWFVGRCIPLLTNSYVASEGLFATSRRPYDQGYVMVPDSCFFEFIPMDGKAAEGDDENPETVLLSELEPGREYELVITNQAGFYRYRMGDVIRVFGFYNESPIIGFAYRKKHMVSLAGEKFNEDHLLSAVKEFQRRTGIDIIDYCMYPDTDSTPGRYVILLEPEKLVHPEQWEECQKVLGEELARASTSYAHYVSAGSLAEPELVLLQPETFHLYREMRILKSGISENQIKTIRVLDTPEQINFFRALALRDFREVEDSDCDNQ